MIKFNVSLLPSLLESKLTRPLRHASVISEMLLAHRPIAWIVAAANSLSELVTYVWNSRRIVEIFVSVARLVRISNYKEKMKLLQALNTYFVAQITLQSKWKMGCEIYIKMQAS